MHAIEIDKLVKEYQNGVRALNELSLSVKCGEIFALLGPNGAGKSSLVNILTTYLAPTSGSVTVLGKDLPAGADFIRSRIACVAQQVSIDAHLSLMENMLFQSRLYRVDPLIARERIKALIDGFDLGQYLQHPVAAYSGGIKRRLDVALSMISHPQILFMDEPTVGMDIGSRRAMWGMMRKIRDEFGATIFLTTHYLEEADQLSDTICIMKDGHEVAQGTPENLRRYIRQDLLRIRFDTTEKASRCGEALAKTALLKAANLRETSVFAAVDDGKTGLATVGRWLFQQDMDFTGIEIVRPGLEDVFLRLTKTGAKEGNTEHA